MPARKTKKAVKWHEVPPIEKMPPKAPFEPTLSAADEAEFQAYCLKVMEARCLIIADATRKGFKRGKKGAVGSVECPACKKAKMLYSVATNGHVRAECPTKDCLRWLE